MICVRNCLCAFRCVFETGGGLWLHFCSGSVLFHVPAPLLEDLPRCFWISFGDIQLWLQRSFRMPVFSTLGVSRERRLCGHAGEGFDFGACSAAARSATAFEFCLAKAAERGIKDIPRYSPKLCVSGRTCAALRKFHAKSK